MPVFNVAQLDALPVQSAELASVTHTDPVLSKVLRLSQRGWPDRVADSLRPYWLKRTELTIESGCILWGVRVLIPARLRERVLDELHRGHQGIVRMKSLARSHVWWPGLDKDLEVRAKACTACQAIKNAPPKAPLHPWAWPTAPWLRIHADFAGPIFGKMLLVVTDAHSKWPEVCVMTSTTADRTIAALRDMFAQHGIPEQLVSA